MLINAHLLAGALIFAAQGIHCAPIGKNDKLAALDEVLPVVEALANGAGHPLLAPADGSDLTGALSLTTWDLAQVVKFCWELDDSQLAAMKTNNQLRIHLLAMAVRDTPLPGAGNPFAGLERMNARDKVAFQEDLIARYKSMRAELELGDDLELIKGSETFKLARAFACPESKKDLSWTVVLAALKEITSERGERVAGRPEAEALGLIERHAIKLGSAPVRILHHILLKDVGAKMAAGPAAAGNFEGERAKFTRMLQQLGYQVEGSQLCSL